MERKLILIGDEEINRQKSLMAQVRANPRCPKSYFIITYGCQMNNHDSEKLSGIFEGMGIEQAPCKEEADIVIFNTCCIRENAERKALGNILWLNELKKQKPQIIVGVCGCMMQQKGMGEKVLKQYPFVDLAFGTGNMYKLPEFMLNILEGLRSIQIGDEDSTLVEGLPIAREGGEKAYITIMYGCNNFCSYCIVPFVRGCERSREAKNIVSEALELKKSGVKEIMLLGQNVNSFGLDNKDVSFPELLKMLCDTGIERIRFMTSHPKDLSEELIRVMAKNKQICPHLHLPVQSGSNEILKRMNRRYTRESYLEKVHKLRAAIPNIGLTTDIIVAFPSETDEQFNETLELLKEVRYDSAFTFIYSPRKGTLAENFQGRVSPEIAGKRIERLMQAQEIITREIFEGIIGNTEKVLVEGVSKRRESQLTGKGLRNISVNFEGAADLIGKIVDVEITGFGSNTLRGKLKGE